MTERLFQDKLCAFIGKLERRSRAEAKEMLFDAGGIPYEGVNYNTHSVIVGSGAEKTKQYQTAIRLQDKGFAVMLTEEQFYNVLENKTALPVNPNRRKDIIVIPADNPEPENDYLRDKRLNYLASKRFDTPEGPVKVDIRPLVRMMDADKESRKEDK